MSFQDERFPEVLDVAVPTTVDLPADDLALLRALALRTGLSPAGVVRLALLALAERPRPRRAP